MSNVWVREASWIQNVHEFSSHVLNWKKEVYGHVGRRKRQILNRLEGINRSLIYDGPWSSLSQLQKGVVARA